MGESNSDWKRKPLSKDVVLAASAIYQGKCSLYLASYIFSLPFKGLIIKLNNPGGTVIIFLRNLFDLLIFIHEEIISLN